eukprot:837730-Rhodomonas_salina.2
MRSGCISVGFDLLSAGSSRLSRVSSRPILRVLSDRYSCSAPWQKMSELGGMCDWKEATAVCEDGKEGGKRGKCRKIRCLWKTDPNAF